MADETREELGQWERECGGYFMRSEQGASGKLVRLDRVRRWLMAGDDGLPYAQAGEALLAPLDKLSHAEIGALLYLADEGNHARLVRGSDDFLRLPVIGLDDRPSPENCGVRGALHHARGYWCERPGNGKWFGQEAVEPLAVPIAKANELWGWGSSNEALAPFDLAALQTFDDLVAYRKQPNPAEWSDGEQRRILAVEIERLGGSGAKGAAKGAADKLGISVRAVNGQLGAYKTAARAAATLNPSAQVTPFQRAKQSKRRAGGS